MTAMLCTFGPSSERKRTFILKFEDRDRGDMYFDNESEAVAMFLRCADAWTCTLFGTVEMNTDGQYGGNNAGS